jgi:hypothetical protein
MSDDLIPDDLREFIMRYIDSVSQLEALLLLRTNPREDWDVGRAATRLYTAQSDAAIVLARLCEDGLIACQDDHYHYDPDPAKCDMIDRLAITYARHLIPVTNMIHAKPRRIREFADAFRFRKDR